MTLSYIKGKVEILWRYEICITQEFLNAGINFSLGRAVFPLLSGIGFLKMKKMRMTGNKFCMVSVDHSILTNTPIKTCCTVSYPMAAAFCSSVFLTTVSYKFFQKQ